MSSPEAIKKLIIKLIRFGYHKAAILSIMHESKECNGASEELKWSILNDVLSTYPNYGLIQKLMRSDLVVEDQGEDPKITVLDSQFKSVSTIHRNKITDLFDPKFDIKSRIYVAKYEYLPYKPGLLIKNEDGSFSFNTYSPPFWYEDFFYSKGESLIKKVSTIPKIYEKFLYHLVGGKQESYTYVLKWLANGIKRRNYCILTTIGQQGIGKGVLGEIMRKLFGSSNFYQGSDRMFKGTFNSQIANKRLVYCDEIYIKSKEEEDKLKQVVNDFVEIEKKGIDAKELQNYANFYISSNNLDAISLTADDRRFSIIDLTDSKLTEAFDTDGIKELFEDSNILKLSQYLWNLEVSEDEMMVVFKSERTEDVRSGSLKEWEEWFLFKYCSENSGKKLEIWDAGEAVKEQFGFSVRIGRGRFIDLSKKYPSIFNVKLLQDSENKRSWILNIL